MAKPDLFADPHGYLHMVSVDQSLRKLKHRKPGEFKKAYAALTALNPKNRLHRNIVRKIYHADDPAKSLLQWWRGPAKIKGKDR